jgi:hypothetical protein
MQALSDQLAVSIDRLALEQRKAPLDVGTRDVPLPGDQSQPLVRQHRTMQRHSIPQTDYHY